MSNERDNKSGIMIGIAALITAIATLLGVLYTVGFFKHEVSPPQTSVPITTEAKRVFELGYDLKTLQAYAILSRIEKDPFFIDTYNGLRQLVFQDAKLAGIAIEKGIPTQSELQQLTVEEVQARFEETESEVRAKVEAEGSTRVRQYNYGDWLGKALLSVAVAQSTDDNDQVRQLLNDRIDRFDKDFETFEGFDISSNLKEEFRAIRNELATLADVGSVTKRDYVEFGQKVYALQNAVLQEGEEQTRGSR